MKDVWTQERTMEFQKIFGAKIEELSDALGQEGLSREERFEKIDEMMAYLDLMSMVDTARKKQIRKDVKKTIQNNFYAILKLIKIEKGRH